LCSSTVELSTEGLPAKTNGSQVSMQERVRVRSRVVIVESNMASRQKHQDRDDERLERDEMRHSDEPRWVCMGLVSLFQEVQDVFGRLLFRHAWHINSSSLLTLILLLVHEEELLVLKRCQLCH
jgi:hypothetical protein